MKINSKLIWKIISIILLIISILAFIFRFHLRLMIPFSYHHFTTVMILQLIIFNIINIIIFVVKLKTKNWLKTILSIASVIGYIFILTKVSTNNRKEEMAKFLQENEQSLISIVQYVNENNLKEGDARNMELMKKANEMNLEFYIIKKDVIFFRIFDLLFFNYDYGIAYSEKEFNESPKFNYKYMTPYSDWFKVKDNWYYYELAD